LGIALWDTHDSLIIGGGGLAMAFGCTIGAGAAAPETLGGSLALVAVCAPPVVAAGGVSGYLARRAGDKYAKDVSRNG
jgi:hypothetical protein